MIMVKTRRNLLSEWGWRYFLSRPAPRMPQSSRPLTMRSSWWRTARSGKCWMCTRRRTRMGTSCGTLWQVCWSSLSTDWVLPYRFVGPHWPLALVLVYRKVYHWPLAVVHCNRFGTSWHWPQAVVHSDKYLGLCWPLAIFDHPKYAISFIYPGTQALRSLIMSRLSVLFCASCISGMI